MHSGVSEPADVVAYLRARYPHPLGLSSVRLRRMAYLADWKNAIERGWRLTDLSWGFGARGPGSPEVERLVEEELSGAPRGVFADYPSLTVADKRVLRFVVRSVASKDYSEMEKLVYSTYPVFTGERYAELDLVRSAREYERIKSLLR